MFSKFYNWSWLIIFFFRIYAEPYLNKLLPVHWLVVILVSVWQLISVRKLVPRDVKACWEIVKFDFGLLNKNKNLVFVCCKILISFVHLREKPENIVAKNKKSMLKVKHELYKDLEGELQKIDR